MSKLINFLSNKDYINIKLQASHLNFINGNDVLYSLEAAKLGLDSWLKPTPKPQLIFHDKNRDAIGRIIGAEIVDVPLMDNEPKDCIQLTARISDRAAMEKIMTGLYQNCSVGSMTTDVQCSICNQHLTKKGLCEHERNKHYDGKQCYWIINAISYMENSFIHNGADPWARIISIDCGTGYIPYKEFLDNLDVVLDKFNMEDTMSLPVSDAVLSTAARNKLPDSSFCGPSRSFPAHDKAHVVAGLRLLNKSNFSAATKTKIKACLYRKGKAYGITPSADELKEDPNLLTFRIDEQFTADEITVIKNFFDKTPDILDDTINEIDKEENMELKRKVIDFIVSKKDLSDIDRKTFQDELKIQDADYLSMVTSIIYDMFSEGESKKETAPKEYVEDNISVGMKYEEIHTSNKLVLEKLVKDALAKDPKFYDKFKVVEPTTEMAALTKTISDKDTEIASLKDENNKFLDELAKLEQRLKDALVDSILDLKKTKKEDREETKKKIIVRKIDSLCDTINDLRSEVIISTEKKVDDPTFQDVDSKKTSADGKDPKFAVFYQKNEEDN